MSGNNRFAISDEEFNTVINVMSSYLSVNKVRLLLTAVATGYLTQLLALINTATVNWNTTWALYIVPTTATDPVIAEKIALRPQIETLFREIFAEIPFSVLTLPDRTVLGLPLPSGTHTPAVTPTSIPQISVTKREHLSITISVLENKHNYTITNVDDAASIQLDAAFLAPNVAETAAFPAESDFHLVEIATHSTITRSYDAAQVKGTEYLRARYLSSRNQPGSWSEVVAVAIS